MEDLVRPEVRCDRCHRRFPVSFTAEMIEKIAELHPDTVIQTFPCTSHLRRGVECRAQVVVLARHVQQAARASGAGSGRSGFMARTLEFWKGHS